MYVFNLHILYDIVKKLNVTRMNLMKKKKEVFYNVIIIIMKPCNICIK